MRSLTISVPFYGNFAIYGWWKVPGQKLPEVGRYQLEIQRKNLGFEIFQRLIFLL